MKRLFINHRIYFWLLITLALVALASFADLGVFVVTGGSMEPTYHEGERVVVDKYGWWVLPLHTGNVVVFADPHGKVNFDIKRISPQSSEPGTYFLLGDNVNNSTDSRSFGAVPSSYIVGRVIIKL